MVKCIDCGAEFDVPVYPGDTVTCWDCGTLKDPELMVALWESVEEELMKRGFITVDEVPCTKH